MIKIRFQAPSLRHTWEIEANCDIMRFDEDEGGFVIDKEKAKKLADAVMAAHRRLVERNE